MNNFKRQIHHKTIFAISQLDKGINTFYILNKISLKEQISS